MLCAHSTRPPYLLEFIDLDNIRNPHCEDFALWWEGGAGSRLRNGCHHHGYGRLRGHCVPAHDGRQQGCVVVEFVGCHRPCGLPWSREAAAASGAPYDRQGRQGASLQQGRLCHQEDAGACLLGFQAPHCHWPFWICLLFGHYFVCVVVSTRVMRSLIFLTLVVRFCRLELTSLRTLLVSRWDRRAGTSCSRASMDHLRLLTMV